MVSTAITAWNWFPDVICDGLSDQEEIMTAICEAKGATYDGVDCVGDLDDSRLTVRGRKERGDGCSLIGAGVSLRGAGDDETGNERSLPCDNSAEHCGDRGTSTSERQSLRRRVNVIEFGTRLHRCNALIPSSSVPAAS